MRVVLAGGGTTGHIAPMLATADALTRVDPAGTITCVGTASGLEATLVPQAGRDLRLVAAVPLPRRPSKDLVTLPIRLGRAVRQATAILRDVRAEVVAGFGGYASLPVYLAARRLRVPVVVHEANAVPGLANRVAARFATTVCVTFANTGLPRQVVTGMPVNGSVTAAAESRAQARAGFGLPADGPVLLASGGSQGARHLNEALLGALPRLTAAGIAVLHVTGRKNADQAASPQPGYVPVPYVDRMDLAYAAADLMLGRAGAATVCETALAGLPVVFVPLPHGNGEQAKNAAGAVAAGAGLLIPDADLDPGRLADTVIGLVTEPGRLARMGEAARGLGVPDGADRVAGAILAAGEGR